MTTKRCQKCKHFNGFDGVGELWTLCSLGDFMGTKIDCSSFERKVSKVDLLKKIREQQATIKKLQDLCGESDSENAKLRQEIKKLKEEEKLYAQEILRLNELLKQYQSFKDLGGDY